LQLIGNAPSNRFGRHSGLQRKGVTGIEYETQVKAREKGRVAESRRSWAPKSGSRARIAAFRRVENVSRNFKNTASHRRKGRKAIGDKNIGVGTVLTKERGGERKLFVNRLSVGWTERKIARRAKICSHVKGLES